MDLPSVTDPTGVFEYMIALILLIAATFLLYFLAVYFGVIQPFF